MIKWANTCFDGKPFKNTKTLENIENKKSFEEFENTNDSCSILGGGEQLQFEEDGVALNIGSLNCSGLSGKISFVEDLLYDFNLDLIFLMETWMAPGRTKNLSANFILTQEYDVKSNGHYHYGQTILFNSRKLKRSQVKILADDPENYCSAVEVNGVVLVFAYVPPVRPDNFLLSFLQHLGPVLSSNKPLLFMGDFNARHVDFGDHTTNVYGNQFKQWLQNKILHRLHPSSGKWTFIKESGRSIVDHSLVNDEALGRHAELHVIEDCFIPTTEHSLLVSSILTDPARVDVGPDLPTPSLPWNRGKFKKENCLRDYQSAINSGLDLVLEKILLIPDNLDEQIKVDEISSHISGWISGCLESTIGRSQRFQHRPPDFMTPELHLKARILKDARSRMISADIPFEDRVDLFEEYRSAKSIMEEEIKRRKDCLFRDFADKLKTMERSELSRLLHCVKNKHSRSKNTLLKNDPTHLSQYATFFAGQYRNVNPVPLGPDPVPRAPLAEANSPFDFDRLTRTIKDLSKGTASGDSGIINEALIAAADTIAIPLQFLFEKCWNSGCVPSDWKRACIQPIPKKGDLRQISNYRPISLTEVFRKLFECLILPKLSELVEPLSVEQGGFRRRRGTLDQVCSLHEWAIQAKAKKLPVFMIFLDIKAAYDQVDRMILWNKCRKRGMPAKLLQVLQALFDGNECKVVVDGQCSERFPLLSGLLQGSPLSPLLYSVFVDDLVDDLNSLVGTERLSLGGRRFRCLLYADDIVLLSSSWSDLKKLLLICEDHSVRNRYRFGVRKCESVLSCNREQSQELCLYGEALQNSESFCYLGVPFTRDGIDFQSLLRRNGDKAMKAASYFNSLGCNGAGFDLSTCLHVYQTFVRPILEYGVALCPLKLKSLLQSYMSKCMRIMTGCGKNTSTLTVGMFGECHPAEVRMASLQFKAHQKFLAKNLVFSVYYARSAYEGKSLELSCFKTFETNAFVTRHRREGFAAQLENREPVYPKLKEMKDDALAVLLRAKSSCHVFQRKNHGERKKFRGMFRNLGTQDQRLMANWILNRSIGPWRICRVCGDAPESKTHLEACSRNGLTRPRNGGPSRIEELISEVEHFGELEGIVGRIRAMIGDRPVGELGADGR